MNTEQENPNRNTGTGESSPQKKKVLPAPSKEKVVAEIKKTPKKVFGFLTSEFKSYVLTSIVSAVLVLFAQNTFKDTFDDYYYDTFIPIEKEIQLIIKDVESSLSLPLDEVRPYLEEKDTLNKTKALYKEVSGYTPEDSDISKLHTICVSVCEDLYDLTLSMYTSSSAPSQPPSHTASMLSDAAALTDALNASSERLDPAVLAEATSMMTKMEMFEDLRDELCENNGIHIEDNK